MSFPSRSLDSSQYDQIKWVSHVYGGSNGKPLIEDKNFVLSPPPFGLARDFGLASVLRLPRGQNPTITAAWVQNVIENYSGDDVFQASFLETVVFSGTKPSDVEITA